MKYQTKFYVLIKEEKQKNSKVKNIDKYLLNANHKQIHIYIYVGNNTDIMTDKHQKTQNLSIFKLVK